MKKKIVSLFLTTCLLVSSLALTVSASDYDPTYSQNIGYSFDGINVEDTQLSNSNDTDTSNAKGEIILTRHSDGTVTKKFYDDSELSTINCDEKQQSLPEYLPDNQIISAASVSSDEYGRELTNPTDNRVGLLICGFNVNDDPGIDIYYEGTASLQNYDLLISCAHVVWQPQYTNLDSDGWANEITFYAGRSGDNTYSTKANFSNISISQNYVDNTTYYVDDDGYPVVSAAYDWDWSFIQIDRNLGGMYGWFGLHGCGPVETGLDIYTIGYPSDKDSHTQWTSFGEITNFTSDNIVIYNAFIRKGNSGGPILNNGQLYGIVSLYVENDGSWQYSGGTRIYDGLFGLILEAREASAARWE